MRIIGTDIDLDTCKKEGYTMIKYDARKKFNKETYYKVFDYFPDYIEERAGEICTEACVNFEELKESYIQDKEGINSFAETDKHVNFENPTYYDFLNLANDVKAYKGLQ